MKTVRNKIRQIPHNQSNQMHMPKKIKKGKTVLAIFLIMVVCAVTVLIYMLTNTVKTMDVVIVSKESKQVSKTYLGGSENKEIKYIFYVEKIDDTKNIKKRKQFYVNDIMYDSYTIGKKVSIEYKMKDILEINEGDSK